MTPVTLEEVRSLLPKRNKTTVTQDMIDKINEIAADEDIAAHYRNNFVDHIRVMKEGKHTITEYMNAVRYVSYQLRGDNKTNSWHKTFPERYKKLVDRGLSREGIGAHVTAYGKTKLVTAILEQSLIPTHIANAGLFQQAINTQAELMTTAKSEKVRSDAAANLIMHLKPPEAQKVNIEIGVTESDAISDLRKVTAELAREQMKAITAGTHSAAAIAESSIIIEAEIEENE